MSSNNGSILPEFIAAVILGVLAYALSFLFPDIDDNLRLAIAGAVAIVGWVIWHYVISPRFKRFTHWLGRIWQFKLQMDVGKMSTNEELQSLRRQLKTHGKNLLKLEEQAATYGIAVPLHLSNQIDHEKEKIAHIEEQVAQLKEPRSSFTKVFEVAGPVQAIRQLVEATKGPGIEAKYYGCHTPGQDANIKLYIEEVDAGLVRLEFIDSEEKTQGTITAELKAEQMALAESWWSELLRLLREAGRFPSVRSGIQVPSKNRLGQPVGSDLPMVAIDVRHGVRIGHLFVRELEARGFRTKELSVPLTVNSLSGVRVLTLFIARPDRSRQPLTSEEITAIQSFVAYGGGLFLIGLGWVWKDYGKKLGLTMDDYPLNKISYTQFGIYFRGEYLNDPRSEFEIIEIAGHPYTCAKFDSTSMREHPITAGVRKIFSSGLSSTLQVVPPSIPLVWDGNDQDRCVLAAWHMQGQGHVVCLQHEGYFKDDNIHKFDNLKLLINIVRWLSQPG